MRRHATAVLYSFLVIGMVGCEPDAANENLGRVIFETPEIPAGYEPYELPDLTATAAADTSAPPAEPLSPPSDTGPPDAPSAPQE